MSPRPRKASDEEIFEAAYRAMLRLGPAELTLAAIAAEAGVTAGALVQRFGSKRGLQVALAEAVAASAGDMIREMGERHRSPLAAVRAYAECMADLAVSPEAIARNLAYLTQDVTDPDLRRHLLTHSRATRDGLTALLDGARRAKELRASTDPRLLARTLESVIGGALFTWSVYQEGTARRFLREQVDAVLDPHLAPRARSARQH